MIELKIPRPGESINEVVISKWFVADGDFVERDQEVGEIESDKATLPLIAPDSGKITILAKAGTTLEVGSIACNIDNTVKGSESKKTDTNTTPKATIVPVTEEKVSEPIKSVAANTENEYSNVKVSPVAKKLMEENNLLVDEIIQGLRRLGKDEVNTVIENNNHSIAAPKAIKNNRSREITSEPMSQLRKKLSKRLVAVKNETAMLTTFNEVDMSALQTLRADNQKEFTTKHGIKLGYMSLFTKAVTIALQQFPKVNSQIDNENIVSPAFVDVAFAVQTNKGLMVPVLRNTESLSLAEIEKNIALLAEKARASKLSIEEMTGGTFTITNGGVFGSLLSTPIINPPQSAILGMHNIVDRPIAVNGKVEIRPMMYVALSYDHRIIDGRDSVSFLVKVKELLESPYKMLLDGKEPDKLLLDL